MNIRKEKIEFVISKLKQKFLKSHPQDHEGFINKLCFYDHRAVEEAGRDIWVRDGNHFPTQKAFITLVEEKNQKYKPQKPRENFGNCPECKNAGYLMMYSEDMRHHTVGACKCTRGLDLQRNGIVPLENVKAAGYTITQDEVRCKRAEKRKDSIEDRRRS